MSLRKRYRDRTQAGRQLARLLRPHADDPGAIVLALPRGGVPVAYEIAHALHLPLDLLVVRKLGMPGHEEFAIGAIGSGGVRVLQDDVIDACGLAADAVSAVCQVANRELARREALYRGARPLPALAGRTVIVVDDGIATGSTMRAAVEVVRAQHAARVIVAAPVGAPDTCAALAEFADALVCPLQPPGFMSVGQWYKEFDQTSDEEVLSLVSRAWREHDVGDGGGANPPNPAQRLATPARS